MNVSEYDALVHRTDQSKGRTVAERRGIALYGLVGEIGSLVSAIKKKLLAEGGEAAWDQPNEEIKEELGDVLWYCYALSHVENAETFDILASDISLLKKQLGASNELAEKIQAALDPSKREAFIEAAQHFPPSKDYSFDDYQKLAFKTARTNGVTLLEVCLAVLTQLVAELLRATLPEVELTINKNIVDRPCNKILGEVTWHIAAIASLYHLSLDEVVQFNAQKVLFRAERGSPTPLHDDGRDKSQQFPRTFEIALVPVAHGTSRMYFEGRRLGDDLRDNAAEDDGYRFHDVMHLALIAHLGWSPVFRGMMKRKRPDVDEVQDGGRAKVVEELVLKAIHSEGERQAKEAGRSHIDGPTRLFPERSTIPFSLLKKLRSWVTGLEVSSNAFWEWEDAIFSGCELLAQLRKHKQGTVSVDLIARSISFRPTVSPRISGHVVALGMSSAHEQESDQLLFAAERDWVQSRGRRRETIAAKKALLSTLNAPTTLASQVDVRLLDDNQISVIATDQVQDRIWELGAVDFRTTFTTEGESAFCIAVALSDAPLK